MNSTDSLMWAIAGILIIVTVIVLITLLGYCLWVFLYGEEVEKAHYRRPAARHRGYTGSYYDKQRGDRRTHGGGYGNISRSRRGRYPGDYDTGGSRQQLEHDEKPRYPNEYESRGSRQKVDDDENHRQERRREDGRVTYATDRYAVTESDHDGYRIEDSHNGEPDREQGNRENAYRDENVRIRGSSDVQSDRKRENDERPYRDENAEIRRTQTSSQQVVKSEVNPVESEDRGYGEKGSVQRIDSYSWMDELSYDTLCRISGKVQGQELRRPPPKEMRQRMANNIHRFENQASTGKKEIADVSRSERSMARSMKRYKMERNQQDSRDDVTTDTPNVVQHEAATVQYAAPKVEVKENQKRRTGNSSSSDAVDHRSEMAKSRRKRKHNTRLRVDRERFDKLRRESAGSPDLHDDESFHDKIDYHVQTSGHHDKSRYHVETSGPITFIGLHPSVGTRVKLDSDSEMRSSEMRSQETVAPQSKNVQSKGIPTKRIVPQTQAPPYSIGLM